MDKLMEIILFCTFYPEVLSRGDQYLKYLKENENKSTVEVMEDMKRLLFLYDKKYRKVRKKNKIKAVSNNSAETENSSLVENYNQRAEYLLDIKRKENLKSVLEVRSSFDNILKTLINGKNNMYLTDKKCKKHFTSQIEGLNVLIIKMNDISKKYCSGLIEEDDVRTCVQMLEKLKLIINVIEEKAGKLEIIQKSLKSEVINKHEENLKQQITSSSDKLSPLPDELEENRKFLVNEKNDDTNKFCVTFTSPEVSPQEIITDSVVPTTSQFETHVVNVPDEFRTNEILSMEDEMVETDFFDDGSAKPDLDATETLRDTYGKYVDKEAFEFYLRLCNAIEENEKIYQPILQDKYKSVKFSIKKMIILPVNIIFASNSQHLEATFKRLMNVLNSDLLLLANGSCPEISNCILPYAIDILAEKFVSHSESGMTGKSELPFLLSSVIVEIWLRYPLFGDIFLGRLMKSCPYIIPAYFPQLEDQSEEDYYRTLGYRCRNGKVEDLITFLDRMRCMVRLYACITVSPARHKNMPHPHGISFAWKWLAAVLNLEPFSDITAAALYEFLDVTAYYLDYYYKKQFNKIIQLILDEFLPKINEITNCYRGHVLRLQTLLEDILTKGCQKPHRLMIN